ncbi:MAG: YbaN family protein [Fidelibacterota bacterium]
MIKPEIRRLFLLVTGMLSIGLGILGVFLPLLPTTPFLLLAAACFIRSSQRRYEWLIQHRWFGSYIRNYLEKRAIPKKLKVYVLSLLWCTLGYSAIFVTEKLLLRIGLFLIGTAVTIHILKIRTLSPDK